MAMLAKQPEATEGHNMSNKFGLIGSDIEFLVLDDKLRPVPAGLLPTRGVKGAPEKLVSGGVEIDCCGMEITPNPASDAESFASTIMSLKDEARARFQSFDFRTIASHVFSADAINGTRYASEMGCQPDFNVWTGEKNPRPIADNPGLRSFGGHIHVEHGTELTVKAMDLIVGTWSVLNDKDTRRRQLYGKAGAFRPKPYGIEYRVCSNFWANGPYLMKAVFEHTRMAQSLSRSQVSAVVRSFGGPDQIQEFINTSDVENCTKVYHAARAMVI